MRARSSPPREEPYERGMYIVRKVAIQRWVLCAIAGIVPVIRVAHWLIAGRKFPAGMCINCGYDLRATPHRCPECGTPVSPA